ncbi:MAG: right-handed parallel beta-helix repeat-containing protein [Prevotella sp.]|nr:right-handed parallel beta-helix repeat-containing protein [Prevotella sp.]
MLLLSMLCLSSFTSCNDDFESFSSSPDHLLTFSTDTVKLDTVFSNVPSALRDFWVFNNSGDGIRCTNVRLERGNQSGFRVNVDGIYLGSSAGFQANDIEIRKGDSIRVFVELTSPYNNGDRPLLLNDNLIFRLESGVEQRVHLNAYSWDATLLHGLRVSSDTTIASTRPIVIYDGITVDSMATLTIAAGTTLYFHNNAGIEVYGRLSCQGTATDNVVLRGDRIDRMFDYLPYDQVSGQWRGIHLNESSYGNQLVYTDLHSPYYGIVADSSDVNQLKLEMISSTVHNCQGHAVSAENCRLNITNCQLTNAYGCCLALDGGWTDVNSSTLAQFYPFEIGMRALRVSSANHSLTFNCRNTLITGYSDDEILILVGDSTTACNFLFDHCVLRTPLVEDEDSVFFTHVIYEDTVQNSWVGYGHFVDMPEESLQYDFRLDSLSVAIGRADPATAFPVDRRGITRKPTPDIGAYEYIKP